MSDLDIFLRLLGGASGTTLILFALWAILTGHVYLPREYQRCEEERKALLLQVKEREGYYEQREAKLHEQLADLRRRLDAALPVAERALTAAEQVARGA